LDGDGDHAKPDDHTANRDSIGRPHRSDGSDVLDRRGIASPAGEHAWTSSSGSVYPATSMESNPAGWRPVPRYDDSDRGAPRSPIAPVCSFRSGEAVAAHAGHHGDQHYGVVSAFIKSIRGSDV
jgi:hypothetical protein